MRSIAFILDDSGVDGADVSNPTRGNPGLPGTEHNFVSLAHEIASRGLARVILFHPNSRNTYPKTVISIVVGDYPNGLQGLLRKSEPIDCVIVRGHDSLPSSGTMDAIPDAIPVVAWTHNHLRSTTLSYFARCRQIKRVVYVGPEQCALAAGSPCQDKSTYILPGFYVARGPNIGKELCAVYVGALVPQKGFHRLARLWPRIHSAVPAAELNVIGSSQVYHHDRQTGPLGISTPSYERQILRYLGGDPAKLGVRFHGKMGMEKYDVMARSLIGLPNPTGFTECCPASVVEMSDSGAAIVALRQWGMCDTVVDQVTGYLCKDDREYLDRVVSLFENPGTAQSMGRAGKCFVAEKFSYADVCQQWVSLWDELLSSKKPKYLIPPLRGRYPLRTLRNLNRRFKVPGLYATVSFIDRVRGVFLKRF